MGFAGIVTAVLRVAKASRFLPDRRPPDYPFVMVVGRSGRGKSSLIYAGLLRPGHDDVDRSRTSQIGFNAYGIFFTTLASSPNSRAALPPRILRLACSLRNGRS